MIDGKFYYGDAIINMFPGAKFGIAENNYSSLNWLEDFEPPTEEEIIIKMSEMQSEYDNKEYQRKRSKKYPPIGDQLDALFHAGVFPEEMAAQIQAVKDEYPKPGDI